MLRPSRLSLIALCLLAAPFALAQGSQQVDATGEAAIVNGNAPLAKDRALEDALRKAVEQACGVLVVSHSKVEGNQLVEDKILSQARGYVSKYEVLSSKEEGGVVAVSIRATVGTAKLATDLEAIGLTLARKGMPRIAVLISEQRIGELKPAAWWGAQDGQQKAAGALVADQRLTENFIIGEWAPAGFTFVDTEALAAGIRTAGAVRALDLNAEQVRKLGDATGADVVLVGTAQSMKTRGVDELLAGVSHGAKDVAMVACSATVSVRALNADNGEVLAAVEATAAHRNLEAIVCGRDAVKLASKKLSGDLQQALLAAWNRQLAAGARVQLKVTGVDSLKLLNALKAALSSSVRGVRSVNQRAFKKGSAELDLQVEGSAESFASELETQKVAGRKIEVVSMTANQIEIQLTR